MTTTSTSSGLARRLADDLDGSFPEFVHEYQDRLYSGVRGYVGSADAWDVTQEAFIRAHRALGRYPSEQVAGLRLSGWIWTIALNLCRNWARDRSRRPQTVNMAVELPAADKVEADAVDAAMVGEWQSRLAALSEPQRAGVVLRHVVGLSYREISEATGRPQGTVKADVSRGLAALRSRLEQEDYQ